MSIGKSNGLFHRPRPPTPCHSAPAGARAWRRPALLAPPTLASILPGGARGAQRHWGPGAVHPHMRGDNVYTLAATICKAVHPHMRGDNSPQYRRMRLPIGSPPHAWGQCLIIEDLRALRGSPPHAWGQCFERGGVLGAVSVHPHMRGDNYAYYNPAAPEGGSPPHAWGQCGGEACSGFLDRFTPTCVGTINSQSPPGPYTGSPPHAWGQ